MIIKVNGEEHILEKEKTVREILEQFSIRQEGVAVALNYHVLPKVAHESTIVKEGDSLEIIHAVQGG